MKKLVGVVFLLLLAATAFAQDDIKVDAGVTDDSILWGLDKALENIKLLLTFDREERIRIGLAVAEERLAEASELREEGQSSYDTLQQYATALNRVRRQLEKYGADAPEAKEFITRVTAELAVQEQALAEFEPQEDVETARTGLKEEIEKHKSALGIEIVPIEAKVEALISEEAQDAEEPAETSETNATGVAAEEPVEEAEEVQIDIAIKAEIEGNITHVTVTGDVQDSFDLEVTDLAGITAAIAAELGMPESDVADVLTLKNANALQIQVSIEGNEVAFITVKQNGQTQKITLAVTDELVIIKEVAKRTGIDQAVVEETIQFNVVDEPFYIELEDDDDDDDDDDDE